MELIPTDRRMGRSHSRRLMSDGGDIEQERGEFRVSFPGGCAIT